MRRVSFIAFGKRSPSVGACATRDLAPLKFADLAIYVRARSPNSQELFEAALLKWVERRWRPSERPPLIGLLEDNRSDLLSFQMLMKCSKADICQNKSEKITTATHGAIRSRFLCHFKDTHRENCVEVGGAGLEFSPVRDAINNLRFEIWYIIDWRHRTPFIMPLCTENLENAQCNEDNREISQPWHWTLFQHDLKFSRHRLKSNKAIVF